MLTILYYTHCIDCQHKKIKVQINVQQTLYVLHASTPSFPTNCTVPDWLTFYHSDNKLAYLPPFQHPFHACLSSSLSGHRVPPSQPASLPTHLPAWLVASPPVCLPVCLPTVPKWWPWSRACALTCCGVSWSAVVSWLCGIGWCIVTYCSVV